MEASMNQRNHRRAAATSFTLVAMAALAGCSAFNPYQRSARLDNDLRAPHAAASAPLNAASAPASSSAAAWLRIDAATRAANAAPDALTGDLPQALDAVTDQRNEWFGALSSHARTLNGASLALLALTGWGLYEGLKPGFVESGTASAASRRHVAKAAIGAGGAYSLGTLFLNTEHDEAYISGYKALTCLIVRARPYALTTVQWRDLALALHDLEHKVLALDKTALEMRVVQGVNPKATPPDPRGPVLLRAESALRIGRLTLERGHRLLGESATAGTQLRRQSELVVTAVSEELRRNNRELSSPEQLLAGLQSAVGKFKPIEPVDRTDEEKKEENAADKPPNTDGDDKTPGGASAAAKPAAQTSPAAAATQGDLARLNADVAKQLEDIKAAVLDPKAARQAMSAAAIAAKQRTALLAQVKKLEKELDQVKRAKAPAPTVLDDGKKKEVSDGLAGMFQARRHVNAALVTHDEAARKVRQVAECRGGPASALVILPSEDKAAERGKRYEFRVSGAKGQPVVSLDGDAGKAGDGAKSLLVTLEGSVVVAVVTVGADAPEGKLRLIVHDPATRGTEDVVLSVPALLKK
jgi:hypothetical protein